MISFIVFAAIIFLISCEDNLNEPTNNKPVIPYNPSPAIDSLVTSSKLQLKWTSSDQDGDSLVYDLYFGTSTNPPLIEEQIKDTNYLVSGLESDKTYYWKVNADDGLQKTEGPIWSFSTGAEIIQGLPCPGIPTVDYEGKTYHTVLIGDQCWLKENLNVGTIVNVWNHTNNGIVEKRCFEDNPENCEKFGGLYYWNELMQYTKAEKAQGICPDGWHIPSQDEYNELTNYVNGNANSLKAVDEGVGGGVGTNSSGFTALLYHDYTLFWTSTFISPAADPFDGLSSAFLIRGSNSEADFRNDYTTDNYSARCLKDYTYNLEIHNPDPFNGETDVHPKVTFSWDCINPDNESINYKLFLGTQTDPPLLISDLENSSYEVSDNLEFNTTYYWKVEVNASSGTSYKSPVWSFTTSTEESVGTPCPESPTITYEGKTYNTVLIGDQCWLRENLDIGIMKTVNQTDNGVVEKRCYNDDPVKCEEYGGLYTWDEAMGYSSTEGSRGICPEGWHIPTDLEYETLLSSVDNSSELKAEREGGSNSSGFSALLAGDYHYNGVDYRWEYAHKDYIASFWSSAEINENNAHALEIVDPWENVQYRNEEKRSNFSIRCVRGNENNLQPNLPENPFPPEYGVIDNEGIKLYWACSDPNNDLDRCDLYFGTDENPELLVSDLQNFSYDVSNLNPNSTYYWKVVAKDSQGNTTVGNIWSFKTKDFPHCPEVQTVEYQGQTYNTVQIGDQCWLRENLNVGEMIDGNVNQGDNNILEKYCPDDEERNCEIYGGLYTWDEAMLYSNADSSQGICPDGWHIPALSEYEELSNYVNDNGKALMISRKEWNTKFIDGVNLTGFTALFAGDYYSNFKEGAYLWSSTEYQENGADLIYLYTTSDELTKWGRFKDSRYSIRCIKN